MRLATGCVYTAHPVAHDQVNAMPLIQTAQQRFDATYICSSEIQRRLKVARTTITQARRRGMLPDPIVMKIGEADLFLWERETVEPYLSAWSLVLRARRRELPV